MSQKKNEGILFSAEIRARCFGKCETFTMYERRFDSYLIKITEREGTILSAHCLGFKAGLTESCSHIASVLFYLEAWTKINGRLSCTQVKCT